MATIAGIGLIEPSGTLNRNGLIVFIGTIGGLGLIVASGPLKQNGLIYSHGTNYALKPWVTDQFRPFYFIGLIPPNDTIRLHGIIAKAGCAIGAWVYCDLRHDYHSWVDLIFWLAAYTWVYAAVWLAKSFWVYFQGWHIR